MDSSNRSRKKRWNNRLSVFWNGRIEWISGILMLIGVILSFFLIHAGGALAGLAFGICFYDEMHAYLVQLGDFYVERGSFKTFMLLSAILYLLISVPAFVVAAAIGFGIMYFWRYFYL